jgi:hypothetical protein
VAAARCREGEREWARGGGGGGGGEFHTMCSGSAVCAVIRAGPAGML